MRPPRTAGQAGLTIVELLVTILVIGVLAAIALPSLLGQSAKASDAEAKVQAKTMLTAMRICGLEQGGSFTEPAQCNLKRLREIEASIAADGVSANPKQPAGGFTLKATSGSKTTFTIVRNPDGTRERTCKVKSVGSPGGCDLTKGKNGVW
jgi:type IV pilus assembly protein PilA